MLAAFYDEKRTFEQNYKEGPPISRSSLRIPPRLQSPKYTFLGYPISLPFGISAGPLLNSHFVQSAFAWGFDVSTYKTVRSTPYPCHPFPNILFLQQNMLNPDNPIKVCTTNPPDKFEDSITITNSFGVPSKSPKTWQKDVKKALDYQKTGQLLILSFMGTAEQKQTKDELISDFAKTAGMAEQTGAKILEVNLSCPNVGNEGLVCYDLQMTENICQAIRKMINNKPLIIKVGYYTDDKQLEKIAEIGNRYAQAIAVINTLQAEVLDSSGKQALPGNGRLRSGICGSGIKRAGLKMTAKLNHLKKKYGYSFEIVSTGGVITPKDFFDYRDVGANLVQSATGAIWNPYLAYEISQRLNKETK